MTPPFISPRAFWTKKTAPAIRFRKGIEHPDPAICANVILGLVKVTSYLLDRQLQSLEQAFIEQGGLREAMTRARLTHRAKQLHRLK